MTTHPLILTKRNNTPLSFKVMVIDDIYANPEEVRSFALQQEFVAGCHHPGLRTNKTFVLKSFYSTVEKYLKPFGNFTITSLSNSSGAFQVNYDNNHSWVHHDNIDHDNLADILYLAAIIYLTPNAPISAGTGIFKHKEYGVLNNAESRELNINPSTELSKWDLFTFVGNRFNRLILYGASQYHMSMNYFGTDNYNCRLIQVFFLKAYKNS